MKPDKDPIIEEDTKYFTDAQDQDWAIRYQRETYPDKNMESVTILKSERFVYEDGIRSSVLENLPAATEKAVIEAILAED